MEETKRFKGDDGIYWFGIVSITDGEYEYWEKDVCEALTEASAVKKLMQNSKEWTKNDYREVELVKVYQINQCDYEVLCQFLN